MGCQLHNGNHPDQHVTSDMTSLSYTTVERDCFLKTQYLSLQTVPFHRSDMKQNVLEGQNLRKENRKSTKVLNCGFHAGLSRL